MRATLRECCNSSGVAAWSASRLLEEIRANLDSAELVHNFDSGFFYITAFLEEAVNNTLYLANPWQLGCERGGSCDNFYSPAFNSNEDGIFRLPTFAGNHEWPGNYTEASGRLIYAAANMMRVDFGLLFYGNVSAVLSPRLWRDAVAASPIDSGLWTISCNETFRKLYPYAVSPECNASTVCKPLACNGSDPTPGVRGAMDHAVLNNWRLWNGVGADTIGRWFGRWHGDAPLYSNVSGNDSFAYLESDILANVRYEDRALKMLVGAFAPLFGTPRGQLLRYYARARRIPLAWALGDGLVYRTFTGFTPQTIPFEGSVRILDPALLNTSGPAGVNASVAPSDIRGFDRMWHKVAAARDAAGNLSQFDAYGLWAAAEASLPMMRLGVPAPHECADWASCLGARLHDGACVCLEAGEEA